MSDRRLKRDVVRAGRMPSGLPLYRFRYLWDAPELERIGVMADEAEAMFPDAVDEVGGFKRVNWAGIG